MRGGTKALGCGLLVIASAAGAGDTACTTTRPTELVPGVLTQVQVPRDLKAIQLEVHANGRQVFCQGYVVYDGTVRLPRTLGLVPGASSNDVVKVTIRGYDAKSLRPDGSNGDLDNCLGTPINGVDPTSGDRGPRMLRRSIQTFVDQQTLFLPMPLSYSCWDQPDCGDTQTCKASRCHDATVDPSKLADFDPSLLDGKSNTCFDPSTCFADALPAQSTDSDKCIYTFPVPPPRQGMNVRIFYEDFVWTANPITKELEPKVTNAGEQEILGEDPDEGFTVVDSTHFRLAPGLCDLAKNAAAKPTKEGVSFRALSDIQVASACAPRPPLLPICAGQQYAPQNLPDGGTTTDGVCNVAQTLDPAPSAVYIALDDSQSMHAAFGSAGYATAMSLSLTDPVFRRTWGAYRYFTHDCTGNGYSTDGQGQPLAWKYAPDQQQALATALKNWHASADPSLDLSAAMRPDAVYGALSSFAQQKKEPFNHVVAMFFVNRAPTSGGGGVDAGVEGGVDAGIEGGVDAGAGNDCNKSEPSTVINESQAAFSQGIETYFVVLGSDTPDPSVLAFYQTVASTPGTGAQALDATSSDPKTAIGNFGKVAADLGTCLYEVPAGVTAAASVAFLDFSPILLGQPPQSRPVPANAGCSAKNPSVDGWNIDGSRVRICGASCDALKASVLAATAAAQQGDGGAPPDVPVTATMPCQAP